jgi:FkbM family methyltransferase
MVGEVGYILDIGMHKGMDAEYYLRKGFRVVGIEARADLALEVSKRLKREVRSGQLTILNLAVSDEADGQVDFWVNPGKDDWGSLYREHAEKGEVGVAYRVSVATRTLESVVEEFGLPYYLKSDTEGAETLVLRALASLDSVPPYLSVEVHHQPQIELIGSLPYRRFQARNQWLNPWSHEPTPSREGLSAPTSFTHEHSGPFGRDLPLDEWLDFEELSRRLSHWFALSESDRALVGHGWIDVHCSLD